MWWFQNTVIMCPQRGAYLVGQPSEALQLLPTTPFQRRYRLASIVDESIAMLTCQTLCCLSGKTDSFNKMESILY